MESIYIEKILLQRHPSTGSEQAEKTIFFINLSSILV